VAGVATIENRRRPASRLWEVDVLHWNSRVVVVIAVLALVLIVLAGLGVEEPLNLYW
jgi:hypothetical protein